MNLRTFLLALLFTSIGAALPFATAAEPGATAPNAAARELVVSIVEPVDRRPGDGELYNRVARVFTTEFEARQWPLKLRIERFGANSPDYPVDLRVFLQPIRQELPDRWTFRAWVKLTLDGQPHDFGIVRADFTPRPAQPMDDVLDRLVQQAARRIADKVAPLLVPAPTASPAPTPSLPGELVITIAEPPAGKRDNEGLYHRVSHLFTREFESRKWPLKVRTERFAANTPDHALQLRVALEPVDSNWLFRAWMTLQIRDAKHDLGLVRFSYNPRQWQQPDEVIERSI
jgi:hypothetical protein